MGESIVHEALHVVWLQPSQGTPPSAGIRLAADRPLVARLGGGPDRRFDPLEPVGKIAAEGLTATRYLGDPHGERANDGTNPWIALFAAAGRRAVDDARLYEDRVRELQEGGRIRLGHVRRGSSPDLLIEALPDTAILTVTTAASLVGRSLQAVNQAVRQLTEGGVLRQPRVGRRNRAFEAREPIEAFGDLERRLASPRGDTQVAPPSRRSRDAPAASTQAEPATAAGPAQRRAIFLAPSAPESPSSAAK